MWILGIVVVTIGGIYAGVFSAVEAAAVGALLTLVAAAVRRALNRSAMNEVVRATLKASGTAFLVLFGAFVFKVFLGFTGIAFVAAEWVTEQGFSGAQVVMLVLVMFIVLGTFLDGFAMLVLTVPLVQPILESLGVDMIWFGVMIVITPMKRTRGPIRELLAAGLAIALGCGGRGEGTELSLAHFLRGGSEGDAVNFGLLFVNRG